MTLIAWSQLVFIGRSDRIWVFVLIFHIFLYVRETVLPESDRQIFLLAGFGFASPGSCPNAVPAFVGISWKIKTIFWRFDGFLPPGKIRANVSDVRGIDFSDLTRSMLGNFGFGWIVKCNIDWRFLKVYFNPGPKLDPPWFFLFEWWFFCTLIKYNTPCDFFPIFIFLLVLW